MKYIEKIIEDYDYNPFKKIKDFFKRNRTLIIYIIIFHIIYYFKHLDI